MFVDCLQGADHFRSYREEERKEKLWSPFSGHTSTLCETDREGMHICCGSKEAGVTVWIRAWGGDRKAFRGKEAFEMGSEGQGARRLD